MEDNSKKQNATFLGEVRQSIVKIIYPDGSKNVTYFRGTENGIEDIDGPLAVSYTHLDVYKRQPVRCEINVDTWQKYASPVWMDIDYSNTLNGRDGREDKDEKHICPLQLDTIERLIILYSNKGDTVLTPFLGIGSEAYQAVKLGRKGIGFELKKSYFDLAASNCEAAELAKTQLELF